MTGFTEHKPLDLSALDGDIRRWWDQEDVFEASTAARADGPTFTFYEGPPTANGRPGIHHVLGRTIKDTFCRYKTMCGYRVDRKAGWDTHGLPVEIEVEKELGLSSREDIENYGIAEYNAACRESVLRYTGEWEEYVTRQARWVDFDNDYRTMNPEYMESVIWAFKSLHDKGYVYEGFRVLPYCWNDETPLSNHELRMDDDVYKNRQDPAVTVGLRMHATGADPVLDDALLSHLFRVYKNFRFRNV